MDPITLEDEETEVVKEMIGGSIPRVDVVNGPASGLRFMVLKAGQPQDPAAIAAVQTKEAPVAKTLEAPAADPEAPELVIKADGADAPDPEGLDPTVVAAPESEAVANGGTAPGSDTDPGSPAWEAMDAATARKWTSILARAKNALSVMGDRELQEVAAGAGDGDDVDAAFDLEDAGAAVDYAISLLAPFAVDEQSEADTCADELEGVSKALGPFNAADLDLVEQLSPVVKAGRVLSSANESAIRGAVTSLQNVLNSLPAAPTAPDPSPVAKTLEAPVDPVTDPITAEPVEKAKEADPLVAVYDADGNLLGAVAQANLTPLSSGTPVDPDADPDPAPAPTDPDAVAPAPAVVAAPVAAPVAKAEGEQEAEPAEDLKAVLKSLDELREEHAAVLKRLDTVERMPAGGGPLLSGAPNGSTAGVVLRGQGGEDSEFAKVVKALGEETDPQRKADLLRQRDLIVLTQAYGGQQ
jgi:hypothetical protein